ncbi:MAG: hypothetical protein KatS3mg113_0867 [Planctomycetaceae bacterium]|nr:MAG: hypothetical protein KatS3mg113_0867 [Planctomycetaceae bacterium]
MRHWQLWIACGAMLGVMVAGGVWSQDAKTGKKGEPKAAAEKVSGRLPNNFGQLGLSNEQRQKIYSIQSKYNEQIEELTRQVDALKKKRDEEIENVLTAAQKEQLKQLREKRSKAPSSTQE